MFGQNAKPFVKVFFKRENLTMIVRKQELQESSRNIISKAEAERVLEHIENCDGAMNEQWKTRIRLNEKALEGGDPYELASVFKGLSRMQDEGKTLRAADRKHLQSSFAILSEELATALGKSRASVEALING